MARRNRNQKTDGILRADLTEMSPRSRATSPKPPPCNSKSVIFKAYSLFPLQRIHRSRSRSIPAAVADRGSSLSCVSTRAQTSRRIVAWARTESSKLVRPDDAGPKISVIAPRGIPPARESISGMPVVIPSGRNFSLNLKEAARRLDRADSMSDFQEVAFTGTHFHLFFTRQFCPARYITVNMNAPCSPWSLWLNHGDTENTELSI